MIRPRWNLGSAESSTAEIETDFGGTKRRTTCTEYIEERNEREDEEEMEIDYSGSER
jgi:hypothetical protein